MFVVLHNLYIFVIQITINMVHLEKTKTNDTAACNNTMKVTHMLATRSIEVFSGLLKTDNSLCCKKCQKIYEKRIKNI